MADSVAPAILNCLGFPIQEPRRIHFQFSAPPGNKGKSKGRQIIQYWSRQDAWGDVTTRKGHDPIWSGFPVETIKPKIYKPSMAAWKFHTAPQRYRAYVAGVRSGKTVAGAAETVRAALGMAGEMHWVVAPTFKNLQEPQAEIIRMLNLLAPWGIRYELRIAAKQIRLSNGSIIQFNAADQPDNLRGPTVNGSLWLDEVAFMRERAFYILRTRIITGPADMWFTTSPNVRNWFWILCRQMGLPSTQPYGEFETRHSFISHRPTWDFKWSSPREIEGMRRTWPRKKFDQELGAMFGSPDSQVFPGIRDCLTMEEPAEELQGVNAMGLDLAQAQDFTAVVIMDPHGRVHHIERWTGVPWKQTVARALALSVKYNTIIAYDKSNVGSVVGELLDEAGAKTMAVDCHNAQLKSSMIQGLAVSCEEQAIKLPDPTAQWAEPEAQILLDECEQYEQSLTRHGSLSYSAPKGLHDDLVIALAMANWCRVRGGMGGGAPAIAVIPRKKWDKLANSRDVKRMTAEREAGKKVKIHKRRAGNPLGHLYKGKMGWGPSGGLWR